jgi:ABC-type proline/glycine betaine transport system substrate-binding protein
MNHFAKSVLIAALFPLAFTACGKKESEVSAPAATAEASSTGEAASCSAVKFADIGWTDITATTALSSTVDYSLYFTTCNRTFLLVRVLVR